MEANLMSLSTLKSINITFCDTGILYLSGLEPKQLLELCDTVTLRDILMKATRSQIPIDRDYIKIDVGL